MMKSAKILILIVTIINALMSWCIAAMAVVAAYFDELMDHLPIYSNISVLGSETFAGYMGGPVWSLQAVAVLAFVSGLLMLISRSWWSGWIMSLIAMIPVIIATAYRISVILFSYSMGLFIFITDETALLIASIIAAISLGGLLLKIFAPKELM